MFGVICLSVANENNICHSVYLSCVLLVVLARAFVGCSILTLVLIAVNRWILITKGFETYLKIYRRENIFAMLLLTWLYSVIPSSLPVFLDDDEYYFNSKFRICRVTSTNQITLSIFAKLILPYFTVAPIIVACCYGSILRHVKAHRRRIDPERTVSWAISR